MTLVYHGVVFCLWIIYLLCSSSASERLLEMLGTVVAYVDDVLVSVLGLCFCTLTMLARPYKHFRFINSKQNHHKS